MKVQDYGKLLLFALIIGCITTLLALHSISDTEGVGIIATILGYVTGNGRLAVQGKNQSPALASKDTPTEV